MGPLGDSLTSNNIVAPRYGFAVIVFGSITLVAISLTIITTSTQAQIVSHELRRLAVASNQFGIDVLRALDKIEPPDKVLVFCPVCLSSSLMMIMMGSSKYHVVSSLRHALYVWSMKPQDINRGFKDVFEHIGLNQLNYRTPASTTRSIMARHTNSTPKLVVSESNRRHMVKRSLHLSSPALESVEALSLPKLIKLKEIFERLAEKEAPWWHSISHQRSDKEQSASESSVIKRDQSVTGAPPRSGPSTQRDVNDASQMSAMSNIYIQRGLTMNYNYNLLLRQYYKTVIHPVDFIRNAEETRQHINSLVAANTETKIKDLVKKGSFDIKAVPKVMMISTFHFRGTLDVEMKYKNNHSANVNRTRSLRGRSSRSANSHHPSNKTDTQQKQQSSSSSSSSPSQTKAKATPFIETEPTLLKYGHFTSLDCSVIEIPFNNRLVTLVIVMPDSHNVTELLLTRLSAQVLNDMINSLVVKRLSLGIPVIKFDRGPINMSGLLKELSLDHFFFGNQSFSTETGLNRWLRPSDVVHETSIDIGTMNPNWGVPEDRLKVGAHDSRSTESNHINLDKPFLYFVLDSINGLILTMGRIRQ